MKTLSNEVTSVAFKDSAIHTSGKRRQNPANSVFAVTCKDPGAAITLFDGTQKLRSLSIPPQHFPTCLSWFNQHQIAVGKSDGTVNLYDISEPPDKALLQVISVFEQPGTYVASISLNDEFAIFQPGKANSVGSSQVTEKCTYIKF